MNTKEEHQHEWRGYGQIGGKVVCDGCNVGTDVNDLIKSRESALLSRIKDEVIGEDEYPDEHFPTVLSGKQIEQYDKVTARDRLRATQRTKLDQLSKEKMK